MDFFEICHCLVAVCVLSCSQNKKARRTTETNKEQNLDTPGNAEKEQTKELNMDTLEQVTGGTIPDIQIAIGDSGFYPIYQINGTWYTADAITGKV